MEAGEDFSNFVLESKRLRGVLEGVGGNDPFHRRRSVPPLSLSIYIYISDEMNQLYEGAF